MADRQFSVGLFCGSSENIPPHYRSCARKFGQFLAQNQLRLVYGGGGIGLMGEAARACDDSGGEVLGILPRFLLGREGIGNAPKPVLVDSMHERKTRMYEESDLFVILPGGIGTLEEMIEILSWLRLELHEKPVLIYNYLGYWAALHKQMQKFEREGFLPSNPYAGKLWFSNNYPALIDAVRRYCS